MANTLTGIIPSLYASLNTINREPIGFVGSVRMDSNLAGAVIGQPIIYPVVAPKVAQDIVPSMTLPTPISAAVSNRSMTMSKAREVGFTWNGEEQKSVGGLITSILQDEITECFRTLVNEIETDLAALHVQACRAYGTASTSPFASSTADAAAMYQIFEDNGSPKSNLFGVLSTTGAFKLRSLTQLIQANTAGTTEVVRNGTLLQLSGINWGVSAKVARPASGTAAGATVNAAGYLFGATTLTLSSAGTGTILAGDIITFAGDTNKYVVKSGSADVSTGGTVVLEKPGLRVPMSAATKAITVVAASSRNMVFDKNALILGMRPHMVPQGGDAAQDRQVLQDPFSGLVFDVALYAGRLQNTVMISSLWGCDVIKPENVNILLGE